MELPIFEIFLDESLTAVHSKVSLVKDPAIELNLIKFNSEDKPMFFANEEKREIYAVAMRPNKMIFRKNVSDLIGVEQPANVFYSAETIEKFQKLYFQNASNASTNINHEENDTEGIYCFESWIVKNPEIDKSKVLGLETIEGDLVMAFKIDNDEVWSRCKAGDLDGLSIEAYFDKQLKSNFKTEINMSKPTKLELVIDAIKSVFASDVEEEVKDEEVVEVEEPKEEMAEETPPAEEAAADDSEALKSELEEVKAELAEAKTKLADMEAEKVKAETALETMKKQTPKATPIPTTPKVEMKKDFKDMTPLEQYRFKKEINK